MAKVKKKKSPRITVITPTYNRADYLAETIESVLSQDFTDYEYLILDDGSTDNTEELVKKYLKDKRLKYFKFDSAGEAKTVNRGWQMSLGDFFIQVNSDDPVLPNLFSEMVNALDANEEVVVAYPDFYFIDKRGKIIRKHSTPDWDLLSALAAFSCYAASPGTFIRKEPFKNIENIKDSSYKYISDVVMYWNFSLKGDFLHIPKLLAKWRDHDDSISSERYKSVPEVIRWADEFFAQKNLPESVKNIESRVRAKIFRYCLTLINESHAEDNEILIVDFYEKFVNSIVKVKVGDNKKYHEERDYQILLEQLFGLMIISINPARELNLPELRIDPQPRKTNAKKLTSFFANIYKIGLKGSKSIRGRALERLFLILQKSKGYFGWMDDRNKLLRSSGKINACQDREYLNLLGKKVNIETHHKPVIKTFYCDPSEFIAEMSKFILKTDVVLDIGCGIRPEIFFNPSVHICIEPYKEYRDIIKPFFPNESHFIFLKGDAIESIGLLDDNSVDSVFMIDLIEHLEKERGVELLKEADRVARRQIVAFTPLGFYPMHYKKGEKDAWGLGGSGYQEHKSGWLPEDFGDTYDFYICKDCHEPFSEAERKRGKKYSGLMAIKTKKFNGFLVQNSTPDFVKEVYSERVSNNK